MIIFENFINWKNSIRKELRNGVIMFDVPKHYKWLTETELFEYYITNNQ